MNRVLTRILILILLAPLAPFGLAPAAELANDLPGVRGSLYESPSYGWTLIIDPAWSVDDATSDDEVDTLTLSVNTLPGVSASVFIQSFPGDERDCLRGTIDQLEDAILTHVHEVAAVLEQPLNHLGLVGGACRALPGHGTSPEALAVPLSRTKGGRGLPSQW